MDTDLTQDQVEPQLIGTDVPGIAACLSRLISRRGGNMTSLESFGTYNQATFHARFRVMRQHLPLRPSEAWKSEFCARLTRDAESEIRELYRSADDRWSPEEVHFKVITSWHSNDLKPKLHFEVVIQAGDYIGLFASIADVFARNGMTITSLNARSNETLQIAKFFLSASCEIGTWNDDLANSAKSMWTQTLVRQITAIDPTVRIVEIRTKVYRGSHDTPFNGRGMSPLPYGHSLGAGTTGDTMISNDFPFHLRTEKDQTVFQSGTEDEDDESSRSDQADIDEDDPWNEFKGP